MEFQRGPSIVNKIYWSHFLEAKPCFCISTWILASTPSTAARENGESWVITGWGTGECNITHITLAISTGAPLLPRLCNSEAASSDQQCIIGSRKPTGECFQTVAMVSEFCFHWKAMYKIADKTSVKADLCYLGFLEARTVMGASEKQNSNDRIDKIPLFFFIIIFWW